MKEEQYPMYLVARFRSSSGVHDQYGPTHGPHNVGVTLCGREVDDKWAIKSNNGTGAITCRKCNRILNSEGEVV